MTGLRPDSTGAWNFINYFRQKVPNATSFPQFFKNQPGYLAMGSGKLVIQPSPPSLQSPLHATTITTAFHHKHHCIPPQSPLHSNHNHYCMPPQSPPPPPPGHRCNHFNYCSTLPEPPEPPLPSQPPGYHNSHPLTRADLCTPASPCHSHSVLSQSAASMAPTHTRPLDYRSLAQSSTHTTPYSPCAVPHVQPSRPRRTAQLVTRAQREPNVLRTRVAEMPFACLDVLRQRRVARRGRRGHGSGLHWTPPTSQG
jgi:hypothetical protein